MAEYNGKTGVWRTVGGRRIFIADGEDLASAMKRSGKFKNKKDLTEDDISKKEFEQATKIDDKLDRAILMQVADDIGKELDDDSINARVNYIRNNYNGKATDKEIFEKLKSEYKNRGWYIEKQEITNNSFTMTNGNKEVTVSRDSDGKWIDSDGNKYMGYLSKEDVKKYFRDGWQEAKETRSANEIISTQMSKTAKAQDETARALGLRRDEENSWKSTAQLYREQKGKDLVETAINSKNVSKYNEYVEKYGNDRDFTNREDIDKYAKANNLDADSLYYMTKISSDADRNALKNASWKKEFSKYKKEHPNTDLTYEDYKKIKRGY